MRAIVTEIHTEPDGQLVHLTSPAGALLGCWAGYAPEPVVGESLSVEVEIDVVIEQFNEVDAGEPLGFTVQAGDSTSVCGEVEDVDPDGLVYLRVSQDCLIMVEAYAGASRQGARVRILVAAKDLGISPQ